ncbi:M1 family aminopeptidase [Leucobacter komagatae]|uniref:M1 family aminopeptidase n=1 Tax=Leucobacter komagatae TaxID=55969 RepID=UPI00069877DC|nr:M1 family aminopeptidase [Leucobacter komagatae]
MTATSPQGNTRRSVAAALAFALSIGLSLIPAQAALADPGAAAPIDGAQTSGDSMFPNVGNGGYDALDYDVSISWSPDAEQRGSLLAGSITQATTTMTARADQPLRTFSLDFEGMEVDAVSVNGQAAAWERISDAATITHKLVVEPQVPVSGEFAVTVDYHGVPVTHIDADDSAEGWSPTHDGAILLGQPVGMMAGFPHNNTPGDKATYTFAIDIPSTLADADGSNPGPAAAVSNGELHSRVPSADGARTTWKWRQDKQMASELAIIGIGRYDIIESTVSLSDGRTIPSWSFIDSELSEADKTLVLKRINDIEAVTRNLESVYGPYPGNSTGVVVDTVPTEINYALETQDRSFFPSPRSLASNTFLHELVHQWYGNNVSPSTWTDIWIAEGMASWGPTHYNSANGFGTGGTTEKSYFDAWNRMPASSANWKIPPGAQTDSATVYGYQTYTRSAQFWEALKIAIGDDVFFTLLPEWQARYGGTSQSGAELKALAEELSGRDLTAFWDAWIMTPEKPAWPEKLTAELSTPAEGAEAERGDELSYTLVADNTGMVDLETSVVAVDVSSLLRSADLENPLPAGLVLDGTTLNWAVPKTAPGAQASLTFGATVTASASGGSIDVAASVATLGGTCTECATSLSIAEYEISPAPAPTLSGEPRVGATLTAHPGSWPADTKLSFQWEIAGATVSGATDASFVVPASALGRTVAVSVTGVRPGFLPTTVSSTPSPKIQGAATDPGPGVTPKPDETETVPPALDALTAALEGAITFPRTVHPGERITVGIRSELAGERVEAWLFSDPRHIGSASVRADGSIELTVPADTEIGSHRLVIATPGGDVIGWGPITVEAAAVAATGDSIPILGGAVGAMLLIGGAAVLLARRLERTP